MPILKTNQSKFSLIGRSELFIWSGSEGSRRTESHKSKVFDRERLVFAVITKMYSFRVSSLKPASLKTAHQCWYPLNMLRCASIGRE
jgi:hypothetical protein